MSRKPVALHARFRHRLRDLGPFEGIVLWCAAVALGSLLVILIFLVPWLTEVFEVCDPGHESANTPYGWTVACSSMAVSLMFARWIGSRPALWFAYGSLPLHWLVWYWLSRASPLLALGYVSLTITGATAAAAAGLAGSRLTSRRRLQ